MATSAFFIDILRLDKQIKYRLYIRINKWNKISREYYIIEIKLAKIVDNIFPFIKGVEILPDGSVSRYGGTNAGAYTPEGFATK